MDRTLWEKSGHWENYHDNMFTTCSENRDYAVKPMNCPGMCRFSSRPAQLPRSAFAFAEFGSCHRNETSGSLHGLMRVRGFTQDDAHIFCTENQVQPEVSRFIVMRMRYIAISVSTKCWSNCPLARRSASAPMKPGTRPRPVWRLLAAERSGL